MNSSKEINIEKNKENQQIINSILPKKNFGDAIGKISSSFYYVKSNVKIDDLANKLEKSETIFTLAVVNEKDEPIGIIIRRELFDLLGKKFGRDVYKYKTVDKVLKEVKSFYYEKNIFLVSEELKNELSSQSINYYLLKNKENQFAGIFSTKDLLVYLSEITAQDINLAKKLQSNIVKDELYIKNDKFEMSTISKMAKGVGGDFWTIKKYSETNWVIFLCDVSGKGISASLITAIIGGMFSIYDFKKGLRDFIIKLNDYIAETFNLEKIVNGIFLDLNEITGEMSIYDMAHGYIYLLKNGLFKKIDTGNQNLAVGIMKNIDPKVIKFNLNKNDILVLFTDGIIDQRNANDQEYGMDSITNIFQQNYNLNIDQLNKKILDDINNFKKEYPQSDDLTLLILKFFGINISFNIF